MSYPPPPPGDNQPPPGGGGYPPPPGAGGYAQPQSNKKALWSMILGIVGVVLCCAGILFGVPALILGNMAKKEIAASGGAQTGAGMAKAGVILGIIAIVIFALYWLLWILGFAAMDFESYSSTS